MNAVWKTFLCMSCSGGVMALALFAGKRLWRDRVSRQWQYYIWLVVVLRLLVPFGPEAGWLGKAYRAVERVVSGDTDLQQEVPVRDGTGDGFRSGDGFAPAASNEAGSTENEGETATYRKPGTLTVQYVWLIWITGALVMLIRKITVYQSFTRYLRAGLIPVTDTGMLDRLCDTAKRAGVKVPVELCVNPMVSSPMLTGFFRPCVVLPNINITEKEFQYTALHELTHFKRGDLFYKWLVQITVCLHWFNPLVYLMSREITRACEFSCDEAVLASMGSDHARDYGQTLLDAMAAAGKYRENPGAVTLSENKKLLKERLGSIMKFKKHSKTVKILTAVLTVSLALGAFFVGVYPAATAANTPDELPEIETLDVGGTTYCLIQNEAQLRAIGSGKYSLDKDYMQQADIRLSAEEWIPIGTRDKPFTGSYNGNGFEITGLTMTDPYADLVGLFGVAKNARIYNVTVRDEDITSAGRNAMRKSVGAILATGGHSYDNHVVFSKESGKTAEQYYESGSLPLFEIAFSRLDERAQKTWLDMLYDDGDAAFFSAALCALGEDSALPAGYAERAYADEDMAIFSILTGYMDETELEHWLERAMEDEDWAFQSILFGALDQNGEFDELEAEKEKEWEEAREAEYAAAGVTVDGKDYYYRGQLVDVFLDLRPNKAFYTLNMNPKGTVNVKIVRNEKNEITGAVYMSEAEVTELLGELDEPDDEDDVEIPVEYKTIAAGETIFLGRYTLSDGDKIRYNISAGTGHRIKVFFAKDVQMDTVYWSADIKRQSGEGVICAADFTVGSPAAESGTYELFLQAPDGVLGDVKGSISIGRQ